MGKGSARRKEDIGKIWDNWERTFGKKDKEQKDIKEELTEKKSTEKTESEKNK